MSDLRVLIDASVVRNVNSGLFTHVSGLAATWPATDEVTLRAPSSVLAALPPEARTPIMLASDSRGRHGGNRKWKKSSQREGVVWLALTPRVAAWNRHPLVVVIHDWRHVLHPHEFSLGRRVARRYAYPFALRKAHRLIAISLRTADQTRASFPWAESKLTVIHHGLDHVDDWIALRTNESVRPVVAYAHHVNKRPGLAMDAWSMLPESLRRSHRLHIVGAKGASMSALRDRSIALGISDSVEVHGALADDAYSRIFANSAVILMPSTDEGFGLPVGEAARLRIPVVAAAGAGLDEACGGGAVYVSQQSAEAYAAALSDVLGSPAVAQRLGAAGHAHTQGLVWARTAEQYREVCLNAARGHA